jgi:cell division protein FtsQ
MSSTRRPTNKSSGSKPPADKSPSGRAAPGKPPVGRPQDDADRQRPGIISASKSAEGLGDRPSPALPDNVVNFPESKARRIRRNIIIAASMVAALVAALLAGAIYSPVLAVRTITVQGTKMLTTEQIQTALEPLEGKPLPQVSDSEVSTLLQPFVQIKAVTTQARPPSGLLVQVQERAPVALLKQGETYQLVDIEGVQLSSTTDPASVQLPVIDGGGGAMGKDLFHAITGVLGALPADVLSKLSDASAKSVDAVELKLVDGQTIVWGNAGEKELKAKVLEALLKAPADPKNPVSVYDVSVPRHPVTR